MAYEVLLLVDDERLIRLLGVSEVTPERAVEVIKSTPGMEGSAVIAEEPEADQLSQLIAQAATVTDLNEVYEQHKSEWTQAHSSMASRRKQQLGG